MDENIGIRKKKGDGKKVIERSGDFLINGKSVGRVAYEMHKRKEAKIKAREMADTMRELRKELKMITREKVDLDLRLAQAAKIAVDLQASNVELANDLLQAERQRDYFKEMVEAICDLLRDHIALKELFKKDKADDPQEPLPEEAFEDLTESEKKEISSVLAKVVDKGREDVTDMTKTMKEASEEKTDGGVGCDHTGIGLPGCEICDPRTISEGGPQPDPPKEPSDDEEEDRMTDEEAKDEGLLKAEEE